MSQVLDTFANSPPLPPQKSKNGTIYPMKYGQSLFTEVPLTRECQNAGVSDGYCACVIPKKLPANDTQLIKAAEAAVKHINKFIPRQCAPLELQRVIAGAVKAKNQLNEDLTGPTMKISNSTVPGLSMTYIVAFSTKPGDFLFESNVNYYSSKNGRSDSRADGVFRVSTDLLRMNKISTDVSCVRDGYLEKFCYCNFLLQS